MEQGANAGGGVPGGELELMIGSIPCPIRTHGSNRNAPMNQGGVNGLFAPGGTILFGSLSYTWPGSLFCMRPSIPHESNPNAPMNQGGANGLFAPGGTILFGIQPYTWPSIPHDRYEQFKAVVNGVCTYWSDSLQDYSTKPESAEELPDSDCVVACGYHPGHCVHNMKNTITHRHLVKFESKCGFTYHGTFGQQDTRTEGKHENFFIHEQDVRTLCRIQPVYLTNSATVKTDRNAVIRKAKKEAKDHLPYLPFFTAQEHLSFGINAFERYQIQELVGFIYRRQGSFRSYREAECGPVPDGWFPIRGRRLVRLIHEYLEKGGRGTQATIRIFKVLGWWMPIELQIFLTREGTPAKRQRHRRVVMFESDERRVTYPFDDFVLLETP